MSRVVDHREEPLRIGSGVSWGPILAGVAVAFAVYFLLNLLGIAIGLSVTVHATLGTGAALWAVVSVMLSLFLGGWVTSHFTVGEHRLEAILNGAILWGVSFILLLWVLSIGITNGYGALVGVSTGRPAVAADVPGGPVGVPRMGEEARETASQAAWWAFAGTLLSMLAAIGGTLAGSETGFSIGRRNRATERTHRPGV